MPKVYLTEEERFRESVKREMKKEADAAYIFLKDYHISQAKLAEKMGVTQGAISYQLRHGRILPDVRAALKILRKEKGADI